MAMPIDQPLWDAPPPVLEQPNPQRPWDAGQAPGGQGAGPMLIQQLAKLFMGGGSLPLGGGRFEAMGGSSGGGPSGGGEG